MDRTSWTRSRSRSSGNAFHEHSFDSFSRAAIEPGAKNRRLRENLRIRRIRVHAAPLVSIVEAKWSREEEGEERKNANRRKAKIPRGGRGGGPSGSGLSLFSRVRVTACSPFHGGRGHRLGDKLDRIAHLSSRVRTYLPGTGGQTLSPPRERVGV